MTLLLALAGCWGGDPAPPMWALQEGPAGRRLCRVAAEVTCDDATAGLFPGPVHGDALLVVRAEDTEAGHTEQVGVYARGAVRWLGEPARRAREPVWTPDGREVVFEASVQGFSDLVVAPVAGGPARLLAPHPAGSFEPDVHPGGRRVVFASSRTGDVELFEVDLVTGDVTARAPEAGEDTQPAWSPDGRQVAWLAARAPTTRVHVAAADPPGAPGRPLLPAATVDHRAFAWLPDGRLFVVEAGADGQDAAVLVRGDQELHRWRLPCAAEHPVASPDSRFVAMSCSEGGKASVMVVRTSGGAPWRVDGLGDVAWLPRW